MDPMTMMALIQGGSGILQSVLNRGGQSDKLRQIPTKTKGQLGALDESLARLHQLAGPGYENAIGLLQGMLDPDSEIYKNFEAPYLQQFQQQTIPGLAEQFAGMGGLGGGLQSSGFGQSLSAAGGNLQTSLAQMKEQMRMNAAQGLLGQYNQQFGQTMGVDPFAYTYRQGSPGFGQSALTGAMQGIGQFGASSFMNQGQSTPQQQYPTFNPLTASYASTVGGRR